MFKCKVSKKETTFDLKSNIFVVSESLGTQKDFPKSLMNPLTTWMTELVVPTDCFDLMYRLGEKSEQLRGVQVRGYPQTSWFSNLDFLTPPPPT